MSEIEKILKRELYKKSLYEFVKDFWHTCDPSKFVDGKLIKFYCEVFEYFSRPWTNLEASDVEAPRHSKSYDVIDVRQGKHNLCLNVPPRHTKSMIFDVFGPVWLWLSYPIKAVSVSHTGSLSGQMNSKRYRIINSLEFQELFGDAIILDSNKKGALFDTRGGELYSVNRNAFTGYGGDIIVNDDITNAETARKDKEEMNNAWSYYQNTMPSRINDVKKSFIMNVQQRLAPNDITGHILNDKYLSSQYTFVVLPAIFSKLTYVVCPMSGEILTWKKDETLWPERFGDYKSLKYQVGLTVFETQYQQNPIATDRTFIKEEMIFEKAINEIPSIEEADQIYASHDFPVKDKASNDMLGSTLGYRVNNTLYVIDSLEKHMAFTRSVEYVKQLDTLYPSCIQIIEDKANGSPIIQQLQDEVPGIQAFNPGTASKSQRLESASLYMESGNVVFVKSDFNTATNTYVLKQSLVNLKQRLLNFPYVAHDDIIDSFDMMVLFVFMDKRYSVYLRSFNEANVVRYSDEMLKDYNVIFFNREGDLWKCATISIRYGMKNIITVIDENRFKSNAKEGLETLHKLYPSHSVFIDCSAIDTMNGVYLEGITVVKENIEDFDKSVLELNLAFANKTVLISTKCVGVKSDIETFKYAKTKDETAKYRTEHDGYVALLRYALHYFK